MWFLYITIAIILAHMTYNRFFHPLAKVPGPLLASISPLWLVWHSYYGRRPRLDLALHRKYGSVVRIKPDEIIFSNPDYFKQVYGAGTTYRKARFYEAPKDNTPNSWEHLDMLAEQDIEKLRVQKRFAGPIYSTINAKRHESLIDNSIRRFVKRLATLTNKQMDIYYEVEIANVDIMTEFTFGQPYGAIERGSDDGHMHNMDKMWSWWGWIGNLPWLNHIDKNWIPWKIMFTHSNTNLPVFPFCVSKIMEYSKADEEGKVLQNCLHNDMRQLSKDRPEFVFNWAVRLSMTDLGAGVDTMSWTIAACIVGIGTTPHAYKQVRAEVDAAVTAGAISKDEPISYDQAIKLTYLQACLHEALRIWPNIAIALPRIVPEGGVGIDGYYIPAGYTVGMQSKQLGLNEDIFGTDPQSFRPERWLEADKARLGDMKTRNLSFGGPSRKCPGKNVAWLCMSKVLASFYLNFELEVLNQIDGAPGPGGHVWKERGSFPSKWHGLEVKIEAI